MRQIPIHPAALDPAALLRERCERPGWTQAMVAVEIGVGLAYLNHVLHYRSRASKKVLDYLGLRQTVMYERTDG